MNKDLCLFRDIANHLIFLTTKDEFGSSRSRNIETLQNLYEELNSAGVVPSRGYWTENSLKLFLHRVKQRYHISELYDECDTEFIGRSAWEYQSCTIYEEVIDATPRHSVLSSENYTKSYPLNSYAAMEGEAWRDHEISAIKNEHKKIRERQKYFKC